MTHRERFIKTLRGEPIGGQVPTFELVFFLTMEAFGTEHKNQIVAALTSEGYRPKLVKFKGTFSEM